ACAPPILPPGIIPSDSDLQKLYDVDGMGKRLAQSLDTPQHPQHNFACAGFALRHMIDVHSVADYLEEMKSGAEAMSGLASEVPETHSQLQNQTSPPRAPEGGAAHG